MDSVRFMITAFCVFMRHVSDVAAKLHFCYLATIPAS